MVRSPRERVLYLAGSALALAPIAFGLQYGFRHAYDLRYFALAFATFAGVSAVMRGGGVRRRSRRAVTALAIGGTVIGLCAGVAVARVTRGATWAFSSSALVGSVVFSALWVVSYVLDTLSFPGSATSIHRARVF